MSTPPSTSPSAEAKPRIAPYMPNAFPRSSCEKMARNVASTCGIIAAAAAPCTTRAAISSAGVCASPAARLATPNPAMPARNTRLRPNRSPKLPAMISTAANASMYADTTHSSSVPLAPRSRRIVGSATFTTVRSIMSISAAPIITTAASQRRG